MALRRSKQDDQMAGHCLRVLRTDRGFSQAALARRLNQDQPPDDHITTTQIKNFESGRTSMTVPVLKRLAVVLECTVQNLCDAIDPERIPRRVKY